MILSIFQILNQQVHSFVEQGYAVCNNFVSWGDQGDWGDYDA